MAMHTKLICNYKIFKDNSFVEIFSENYKNQIEIDKNLYANGNLGIELFAFSEFIRAEITLISDDPKATLEVETYDSEDILIKKVGETVVLTAGKDTDNMLVPGEYSVNVRTCEEDYRGFYKINPNSMEWEKLLELRNYIEGIVKGLSYNIYIQRRGQEGMYEEEDPFILEMYKFFEKYYNNLATNINIIIDKPIVDIEKEYEIKGFSKTPDSKSLRWQNKKSGKYNNNPFLPTVHYEKHSKPTINSVENKMLKKILDRMHKLILLLDYNYNNSREYIRTKIVGLENQYNNYGEELIRLKSVANSKKAQGEVKNKIYISLNEKSEYTKKLDAIDTHIKTISGMKNIMNRFENETWLKYIVDYNSISCPTKRLLKNKNYSQVYETYMTLNSMQVRGKDKISYPHKKTSKLFEIYGFLIVKEVLEDIGYHWESGWIKNAHDILTHDGDLLSGENIILVKDNLKIDLIYDREVISSSEAKNMGISQVVSINSKSKRPDILLNLYKDDIFIGSIITEVKYRKKRYIYNTTADTDVIYQLRDYSTFGYYDGLKKRVDRSMKPINKIIVLYPKQGDKCKYKDEFYDFTFIEIEPSNLNEKPYGYYELREEIEEFLGEYIV